MKKKWPDIDKSVLDIDIDNVIENKLYALIEEQKDDIDEYNIMRILITDIAIIEYLYFYLKTSSIITLFDKKYFIVKLEISNTWDHSVYLKEWTKLNN